MLSAQELKDLLGLSEVSQQLGLGSIAEGYQTCPFCQRSAKFRTYGDRTYKCFHPECVGHRGGSIIDFVIQSGKAPNFKEALALLQPMTGDNCERRAQTWRNRSSLLEQVFKAYRGAVTDTALDLLNKRGYGAVLENIPFGYAPEGGYLQRNGFLKSVLVEGMTKI